MIILVDFPARAQHLPLFVDEKGHRTFKCAMYLHATDAAMSNKSKESGKDLISERFAHFMAETLAIIRRSLVKVLECSRFCSADFKLM